MKKEIKDLINWCELSRRLTGSPFKLKKDYIPKRYTKIIGKFEDGLEKLIETISEKRI